MLEDSTEGTEELISRWVHKDRSAILLEDGYTVHEPDTWQQRGWRTYGGSPTGPVLPTVREDVPEPRQLFFSRTPQKSVPLQQPSGPEQQESKERADEDESWQPKGLFSGLAEQPSAPEAKVAQDAASGPKGEPDKVREASPGQPASPVESQESSAGPAASSAETQDWARRAEACRVDAEILRRQRQDDADARAAASAMFCAPKDQDLMTCGKHKGRTYQSVLDEDVDYVKWILEHCSEQSCSGMRRFKGWLLAKAAAGLIARA